MAVKTHPCDAERDALKACEAASTSTTGTLNDCMDCLKNVRGEDTECWTQQRDICHGLLTCSSCEHCREKTQDLVVCQYHNPGGRRWRQRTLKMVENNCPSFTCDSAPLSEPFTITKTASGIAIAAAIIFVGYCSFKICRHRLGSAVTPNYGGVPTTDEEENHI